MAEEFLDAAEIAPIGKEMGGKAVAKCVGGSAWRQTESGSEACHASLHRSGAETAAAHSDKERPARLE